MNITSVGINSLDYGGRMYICQNSQNKKDEIDELIKKLNNKFATGYDAFVALVRIGKPAVPALIEALNDGDRHFKYWVAEALGEIGDSRAVPGLIEALNNDDKYVRYRVIVALGKIKDSRAVPILINVLKDGDNIERCVAAEALGEIKDSRAVPVLIDALKDDTYGVRSEAAYALGQIKDSRVLPALIAALKYKDDHGKCYVADVLVRIGTPAVPGLIEALKNVDEYVKYRASEALGKIGDIRAIPALIKFSENSSFEKELAELALLQMKNSIRNNKAISVESLIQLMYWSPSIANWGVDEVAAGALSNRKGETIFLAFLNIIKKYHYGKKMQIALNYIENNADLRIYTTYIPDLIKLCPNTFYSRDDLRFVIFRIIVKLLNSEKDIPTILLIRIHKLINTQIFGNFHSTDYNESIRIQSVLDYNSMLCDQIQKQIFLLLGSSQDMEAVSFLIDFISDGKNNEKPLYKIAVINALAQIALNSDTNIKKQILAVFKDRLGIGLLNPQEEKDPLVLEAMRKAYNRIKESLKGGKYL